MRRKALPSKPCSMIMLKRHEVNKERFIRNSGFPRSGNMSRDLKRFDIIVHDYTAFIGNHLWGGD
jgi:hypothetical protein